MAKVIVDLFETIEINEQTRVTQSIAICAAERLLHPVVQQLAIGQSGQRVVQRSVEVFQPLFLPVHARAGTAVDADIR